MILDNELLLGIVGAIVTAAATVLGIVVKGYVAKAKISQHEYSEIMDSNKTFRDEIRAELKDAKLDLEAAYVKVDDLKKQLDDSKTRILNLEYQLHRKENEILDLNHKISTLTP